MKHSTFVLAVCISSLQLGCQDSDITDSVNRPGSEAVSLAKILPIDYVFPLSDNLLVPGIPKSFMEIKGELAITITEIPIECGWTLFDVRVLAFAELRPANSKDPVWTISKVSNDNVLFEMEGQLKKSYTISGRRDGLALQITLLISREHVTLGGMRLVLPNVAPVSTE